MKQVKPAVSLSKSYEWMCDEAVKNILSLTLKVAAKRGRVNLVLTGGGTVRGVYARMSTPEYRNDFPWHQIHFFWADERFVPPDHPRSNYRMAVETLLAKVDVPIENIHPLKTREGDIETCARIYEEEIRKHFAVSAGKIPSFDLMLLGIGQDGHVASLFPGSSALEENKRLVVPTFNEELEEQRLSFTLPLINAAASTFFVLSGMEKAQIVRDLLNGSDPSLPASRVYAAGNITWFIDKGAASLLSSI